jgi:hypothetical protein
LRGSGSGGGGLPLRLPSPTHNLPDAEGHRANGQLADQAVQIIAAAAASFACRRAVSRLAVAGLLTGLAPVALPGLRFRFAQLFEGVGEGESTELV